MAYHEAKQQQHRHLLPSLIEPACPLGGLNKIADHRLLMLHGVQPYEEYVKQLYADVEQQQQQQQAHLQGRDDEAEESGAAAMAPGKGGTTAQPGVGDSDGSGGRTTGQSGLGGSLPAANESSSGAAVPQSNIPVVAEGSGGLLECAGPGSTDSAGAGQVCTIPPHAGSRQQQQQTDDLPMLVAALEQQSSSNGDTHAGTAASVPAVPMEGAAAAAGVAAAVGAAAAAATAATPNLGPTALSCPAVEPPVPLPAPRPRLGLSLCIDRATPQSPVASPDAGTDCAQCSHSGHGSSGSSPAAAAPLPATPPPAGYKTVTENEVMSMDAKLELLHARVWHTGPWRIAGGTALHVRPERMHTSSRLPPLPPLGLAIPASPRSMPTSPGAAGSSPNGRGAFKPLSPLAGSPPGRLPVHRRNSEFLKSSAPMHELHGLPNQGRRGSHALAVNLEGGARGG